MYKGVEYESQSDLARHLNCSRQNVNQLLKTYKMTGRLKSNAKYNLPVKIGDTVYINAKAAAKGENVNLDVIYYAIRNNRLHKLRNKST